MPWFRKKTDPISDRAKALNDQIAALEAQIRTLDNKLHQQPPAPKLRSSAHTGHPPAALPSKGQASSEPVFEKINSARLQPRPGTETTPEHYNDLGIRKYDLPALLDRIRSNLRGPAASNPKLVSYLAAGGIQGLRPLRYEKRVARNRFIFFFIFLFVMLLGLMAAFLKHN